MDNELLAVDTEETALGPCAGFASPGTTLLSTNYPITSQLVSRCIVRFLRSGCSRLTLGFSHHPSNFKHHLSRRQITMTTSLRINSRSALRPLLPVQIPHELSHNPRYPPYTAFHSRNVDANTRIHARTHTRNLPLSPCRRGLEDKRSGSREIKKLSPHKQEKMGSGHCDAAHRCPRILDTCGRSPFFFFFGTR